MSKNRQPKCRGNMVLISYGDNATIGALDHLTKDYKAPIDEYALDYLTRLNEAGFKAWLGEKSNAAGQHFTVVFGYPPEVKTSTPSPPPPRPAELLLNYVLPNERREEILGDIEEDYQNEWLPKFGHRHARRLYWWHAIRSIAPMLWTALRRSAIITAIAGALDWLRG